MANAMVRTKGRPHLARLFPVWLRPTALYRFFKDKRASLGSKILMGFALAYAIWPIDLIPDAIPVIGWLDDIGVASAVVAWIAVKVTRHEEALELLSPPPSD
jgi:uncharacterized membrane protein YkvA (DUF1232 family)